MLHNGSDTLLVTPCLYLDHYLRINGQLIQLCLGL